LCLFYLINKINTISQIIKLINNIAKFAQENGFIFLTKNKTNNVQ
jgi:hypothetical protein